MSQIDNATFKCDECGKEGVSPNPDSTYARRPKGWLTLVLFDGWFDGNEGSDPANEWNFCSRECFDKARGLSLEGGL